MASARAWASQNGVITSYQWHIIYPGGFFPDAIKPVVPDRGVKQLSKSYESFRLILGQHAPTDIVIV